MQVDRCSLTVVRCSKEKHGVLKKFMIGIHYSLLITNY